MAFNSAPYGPDIGSYGSKLFLEYENEESQSLKIENIASS